MSNFLEALQTKIALLEDEKEEAEDTLARLSSKLDVLKELLQEETQAFVKSGAPPVEASAVPKRKRGRPKSTKANPTNAVDADVLAEASALGGTDPALAEAIRRRGFSAAPRSAPSYGPGINVDQNVRGRAGRASTRITVEDE